MTTSCIIRTSVFARLEADDLTDWQNWPYWLQALRFLAVTLVAVAFACHAYTSSRTKQGRSPQPRRWAYGMYFFVLSFTAAVNLATLVLTLVRGEYVDVARFRIGLFSLLVIASYVPLLVGFRRPRT